MELNDDGTPEKYTKMINRTSNSPIKSKSRENLATYQSYSSLDGAYSDKNRAKYLAKK